MLRKFWNDINEWLDTLLFEMRELRVAFPEKRWPWYVLFPWFPGAFRPRTMWMEDFFGIVGLFSRVSGPLDDAKREVIEDIISREIRLKGPRRIEAFRCMRSAITSGSTVEEYAWQYFEEFGRNRKLMRDTLFVLFALGYANEAMDSVHREAIEKVSQIFTILGNEFREIENDYLHVARQRGRIIDEVNARAGFSSSSEEAEVFSHSGSHPLFDAYRRLGLTPDASLKQVKSCYRRLVKKYHPDNYSGDGVPEDFLNFATAKFREVQTAYETIVSSGA